MLVPPPIHKPSLPAIHTPDNMTPATGTSPGSLRHPDGSPGIPGSITRAADSQVVYWYSTTGWQRDCMHHPDGSPGLPEAEQPRGASPRRQTPRWITAIGLGFMPHPDGPPGLPGGITRAADSQVVHCKGLAHDQPQRGTSGAHINREAADIS